MRIDFNDKREFRLKRHEMGDVQFLSEHPLLIDYNEPFAEIYINSAPYDVEELINEIRNSIDSITLGWRNWTSYVNDKNINFNLEHFTQNIKSGNGKLLEAPKIIIKKVVEICKHHDVETNVFEFKIQPHSYKLMLIEDNYVIAKEFKLSEC